MARYSALTVRATTVNAHMVAVSVRFSRMRIFSGATAASQTSRSPVQTNFATPTIMLTTAPTAAMPSRAADSKPMARVILGYRRNQATKDLPPSLLFWINGYRTGSNCVPISMRMPLIIAAACSHGSAMACAISTALSIPLILPSVAIFFSSPPMSALSNLIMATASSEPKALFSKSESATFDRSPNLPLISFMISTTLFIVPSLFTKLSPSFFWALPTAARNALYFVPASLPLMVACSCPSTANCSAASIPAAFALAPSVVNAADMLSPVVLNICTAVAVCPATCSTHLLFPMASAWSLKMPYMVPM